MYCPYCGASLSPTESGELRCVASGALFSQSLRQRFEQMTKDYDGLSSDEENPETRLHCPRCGSKTGRVRCLDCGAVLSTAMVYEIVEFNPHVG
jgi:transcription initiation factor TFIIIB Brf1 subunit/transcription initiation factor TFIIB